jgi:hypothetical protein
MNVKILGVKGSWREVADSARTTIGLDASNKDVGSEWKRRMLLCEHSPIRQILVKWKWTDLKYWVSVHLVRHWLGIVHWVSTQRSDRTGVNRDNQKQSQAVTHEAEANAQSIINISRKRLCNCASKETREAWQAVVSELEKMEPEIASVCVPDCVYRGHCFEYKSCGYHKTEKFKEALEKYRSGINDAV